MARFAEAYASCAQGCGATAAREAGYPAAHARQSAWRLLQHEGVQAYIGRLVQRQLAASAGLALQTQISLATRGRSEFVRQQAAADLLNRAGYRPQPGGQQQGGAGAVTITIDLG
jgi:phage terminase small subunit